MSETSDTPEPEEDGAPGALPSWVPGDMDDDAAGAGDAADAALAADADDAADDAVDDVADEGDVDDGAAAAPADAAPAATGEPVTIVLADRLRTPEAEELAETLRASVGASELVFDAREVSDIGAAAVACIISTLHARADISPPAAILSPSPAFVDAFSDLGLFQDLMKMEFRQ
ncbi:hypothetical protein ACQ5SO_15610 [Rhodovulum sp. DZ06]|uniref:hypothetical protein n=1 Tax=Rhodovulum sp. DZ06 TaxID=3425126 RepID=UPI003D32E285